MKNKEINIGIIGLGYVGLPLAVEFSKYYSVTGFDIDKKRIEDLNNEIDLTNEIDFTKTHSLKNLKFTSDSNELSECTIYIVTVPTPIDQFKNPNLNPLRDASKLISKYLKTNDIVIYESTVYPGCTEEFCVPILEKESNLTHNKDFFTGYPAVSFTYLTTSGKPYKYNWQASEYFYKGGTNKYCFAAEKQNDTQLLIGTTHMRQYNYIFNVEDKTIGIARTKCSDDKNMVPNSDEFD